MGGNCAPEQAMLNVSGFAMSSLYVVNALSLSAFYLIAILSDSLDC